MKDETYRAIGSGLRFGYDSSSSILRSAVDLLDRSYWLQGGTVQVYYNEPDRRRYDLVGAVIAATGFEIREQVWLDHQTGRQRSPSPSDLRRKAQWAQKSNNFEVWSNNIGRRGKQGFLRCLGYVMEVTGEQDLELFNDEVAICKDDVLGALTAAADLAEAKGD